MNKIKLDFVDFWGGYIKTDNFFYNLLKDDYEIEISDNPDVVFFSIFGGNHHHYKCKKVFYTGENIPPNFSQCDYSFSFDWLDDNRNYRLPLYVLYSTYSRILDPKAIDISLVKRKFCNTVISNCGASYRNNFINALSKYKKVDWGGGCNNNVGGAVRDKIIFHNQYKFTVAYENDAYRGEYPGYTTEKLMEAMVGMSLPIYRGNPEVYKDFNTQSFINYYDFVNENEMIEYITYLDNNDEEYLEKLFHFWHVNNEIPFNNRNENIKQFLWKILQS